MEYDVFISYSSIDGDVAQKVWTYLRMRGLNPWIAPQCIPAGEPYARAIIDGITKCRLMVVILSKASNSSDDVLNEIDQAHREKKVILPFIIDNTEMSGEMKYYLSRKQWINAYPDVTTAHCERLFKAIRTYLPSNGGEKLQDGENPNEPKPTADLYTTGVPFCGTMGRGEQEGDKAWFDLSQCTEDSAEPVKNTPAPQCCRPSHEPLSKSHSHRSPEHTYGPIVPENHYKKASKKVSVLIGNIVTAPIVLIVYIFCLCTIPFRKKTRNDEVYSSIFAPAEVKKGTNMLVQVFLHTAKHEERVQSIAYQADKNAERRGYTPLSCKMQKGDKADVELNIYDKGLIKNERKSIIWNGEFTQCSFRYFVDEGIAADNLYSEVNVYVNGVPVGCTSFVTGIVAHEARTIYARPDTTRFKKIFVSYSHQDYDRVKYLVQGFRAQGIDYFFDRHNLRGGDVYSERIFEYIDKADLFMLCWSANARKSEYVKKEIERALSHVYPQVARDSETLKIHPISIEPRADLPSSMRDIYHFEEL